MNNQNQKPFEATNTTNGFTTKGIQINKHTHSK